MSTEIFKVIFWGVRGSCPVPGIETLEYGGNTSCVQIQLGNRILIFDSGTGIINLGKALIKKGVPVKADIFITHTHWDHINGFPFFTPAFIKGNKFTIYGEKKNQISLSEVLGGQMKYPYFPVSMNIMKADIRFNEITGGQTLELGDEIIVKTFNSNHPDGCVVFRVEYKGKSCCYITDNEHFDNGVGEGLISFVKNADVVIYDTYFTNENFIKEWGHSTWQEGIKMVRAAKAKKLVLSHYNINSKDEELEQIEKQVKQEYKDVIAAKEGLELNLI